jgi:hypothetical protein
LRGHAGYGWGGQVCGGLLEKHVMKQSNLTTSHGRMKARMKLSNPHKG